MKRTHISYALALITCIGVLGFTILPQEYWGDDLLGKFSYEDFKKPDKCRQCHVEIYQQWSQSMMSQAYEHHWDEIEYFKLAVPHAEKNEKVAGVKAGCNGCHAPMSFMAGDVPPPLPEEGSRANEAVSCDVCHTIAGYNVEDGSHPFNYSYKANPGKNLYYGNRDGVESPEHTTRYNPIFEQAEFCGNCHNEKSPWGVWVKSTQKEWAEGPYKQDGVTCQECHMPAGPGTNAKMGKKHEDIRYHLFHGAHDEGKVRGVIEMRMTPDARQVIMGDPVQMTLILHNAKAGHMVPSGSAEERQLWVTVQATDSAGNTFHLPVDTKGFEGEEHTITSNEPAYWDIGEIMDVADFQGLARDAVEFEGDRIFCLPYFDEQGRRTIAQWNTASLGHDYRIPPRGTRVERYTWEVPFDLAPGPVTVTATLRYRRLVKSVADYLGVPAEEYEAIIVNTTETSFNVID